MAFEKDENEIGALWTKQGAKGPYMTGEILVNGEKVRVVCFAQRKTNEKSPDWRVLKSVPRETAAPVQAPDADDLSF